MTTFESLKARVINCIAKQHVQAAEFIQEDMGASNAVLCWGIRIANHEVAIFWRFILLPTSDDGLFAQWCWSLAASKQGQRISSIGHQALKEDQNKDGASGPRYPRYPFTTTGDGGLPACGKAGLNASSQSERLTGGVGGRGLLQASTPPVN
ncbi:hypothetical protein PSHT_01595 [Puccinia striiformis]|uniref:Uncharacterized protein n=1 Tax=Puccinia striiformis TaxID=27350 RepID=A0A2S4WKD5_9BASI|nr:hypothetical protein PSHT_01595 [Puccinia striiformis]